MPRAPEQLSLFPNSRAQAAATRREAFDRLDRNRAFRLFLGAIRAHPAGLTCDEIEVITGMPHQTASSAQTHLMYRGAIVAVGKRVTRHGRNACVWQIARKIR